MSTKSTERGPAVAFQLAVTLSGGTRHQPGF